MYLSNCPAKKKQMGPAWTQMTTFIKLALNAALQGAIQHCSVTQR